MTIDFEKPCILIGDDSREIRHLIKLFYNQYDIELIEAINGQEAVEMARIYSPDMILLDLHMPVLSGYEAAAILKNDKTVQGIPLLVITGQERGAVEERIRGMYDGYLGKPFTKEDLIQATRQFLPGILG